MSTESVIGEFAKTISKTKSLRKGIIAFRIEGAQGGDFHLDCSTGEATLMKGLSKERPLVELIGESRNILAVLKGTKDARKLFLAGGFRVRGDLSYISDLALELKIIDREL